MEISERKLKNVGLKKQGKRYTYEKEFSTGLYFNLSMSDTFGEITYCLTDKRLDKVKAEDLDEKDYKKFEKFFDELIKKLDKLGIKI